MSGFDPNALDSLGSLPNFGNSADPNHYEQACVDSEDDDCCKTTGVTDEGIAKSSKWKALLSAAILAYNTLNSLRIAKLQRELGRKYLELAEEHRKYYNERYKPLEIDLTKEALKLPRYVRDKEPFYTGQMLVTAKGKVAGVLDKTMSCTGRYCTGQRAAIMTDKLLEQATIESMSAGLAHRYTDKDEINHNNLRWEKREQVMKIGRDIPTEAVSYANLAAGTFGSLGKQAGQAAEGAAGFLGYLSERGQTQYPPRRGPINIPSYSYRPNRLDTPDVTPRPTYKRPDTPTTEIRLSG